MINLLGYQDQLTRLINGIYSIQPKSELYDVVKEFRIPEYDEMYQDRYAESMIQKIITFLPKGPVPFDVIDSFIDMAFKYFYRSQDNLPTSFFDLLSLCLDYTPNYPWKSIFDRELIYTFLLEVDEENLFQVSLIPFDKPLEYTNIRPLLGFIFKSLKVATKVEGDEKTAYITRVMQMTSTLCRIFTHIEVNNESGQNIEYYPLTEDELDGLKKWGWSLIEYNLFSDTFDEGIYEFCYRYSDLFVSNLLRCVEEGISISIDASSNEVNKGPAAIRALILGVDLYLYPKVNTEYLSMLVNSLDTIINLLTSLDPSRLVMSLNLFSTLYKYTNLSMSVEEYEKIYESDGPLIQSLISQLFEWLLNHASNILVQVTTLMKTVNIPWNDVPIQLFPIILSTLKSSEVEKVFNQIMEIVVDNLDNIDCYTVAVSEICAVTPEPIVSKFINNITSKFIVNNTYTVNQEMIGYYYDLLTEIVSSRILFIYPNWGILKHVIDVGLEFTVYLFLFF